MKDDAKKKKAVTNFEKEEEEEKEQLKTVFSNNFGYAEKIVIPELEVMARLSSTGT